MQSFCVSSHRFSPEDQFKKFGKENTPEYTAKIKQYRKWTIQNLFTITNRFIVGFQENIHCFPRSVCWLVKHIATLLVKCGTVDAKEINAMCIDLVFTHFICPAVVNPELYGICDAQISPIARFNLMQVGQILQMLALMKYEEPDPKHRDLYALFSQNSVSGLVDGLLNSMDGVEETLPMTGEESSVQCMRRTSALFTEQELHNLVCNLFRDFQVERYANIYLCCRLCSCRWSTHH